MNMYAANSIHIMGNELLDGVMDAIDHSLDVEDTLEAKSIHNMGIELLDLVMDSVELKVNVEATLEDYIVKQEHDISVDGVNDKTTMVKDDVSRSSSCLKHRPKRMHRGCFKCATCDKEFNLKTDLKRHHVVHTNEKSFKCDICGSTFSLRGNLNQHQRYCHQMMGSSSTTNKPFQCIQCHKRFARKAYLTMHEICHTEKKPYGCVCGKTFKHKRSLVNHCAIHCT